MSLSLYEISTPIFVRILNNLSEILKKAEAHATAKKIDPSVFITARLAPDMFPLSRQIQITSDGIKGGLARLAGIEIPAWEDNETTFAELQERIAKTIKFAESIPAAKLDGAESRNIVYKRRDKETTFTGIDFLQKFVVPNFYFHVTTTYAILRHNGVEIGKNDFLGAL